MRTTKTVAWSSEMRQLRIRPPKIQPSVILSGTSSGRHAKGGEQAYSQYVRHLEKTSPSVKAAKTAGTVENFAQGYQDYLQAPLQVRIPFTFHIRFLVKTGFDCADLLGCVYVCVVFLKPLMDNLQSMTYQTFEQDPVKYRNYEEVMKYTYHFYTAHLHSHSHLHCLSSSRPCFAH